MYSNYAAHKCYSKSGHTKVLDSKVQVKITILFFRFDISSIYVDNDEADIVTEWYCSLV